MDLLESGCHIGLQRPRPRQTIGPRLSNSWSVLSSVRGSLLDLGVGLRAIRPLPVAELSCGYASMPEGTVAAERPLMLHAAVSETGSSERHLVVIASWMKIP